MTEVVFVNRYFFPDHSASSQMATDLAFHFAARGVATRVITSRQRYDDAHALLPARSNESGVEVQRVWSSQFGRAFLPGRAVDYTTFYVSAFFALLRRTRRGRVVIAMTDPPLISVVAAMAAKLRGGILINWTQDLFPEVAEELGMRALRPLRKLRNWSLRRARVNVALGDLMAKRIAAIGAPATVRHNWAAAELHETSGETLRREWDLGDAFVAGYSGNLGRAHDFETITGAMRLLRDDDDVRFLFIGGGAQLDRVRAAGGSARFAPYQPRERLSESLSTPDVHLVTLLPQLEGLIVPSKFYGALAVARPVIFIGALDGELARIIEAHDCGMVVDDAYGLARAIRELARDRERGRAMGRRGRALYEREFAPDVAFAAWEKIAGD
jgi:colanic acid biosynthesis glycosyl transferase WcaI